VRHHARHLNARLIAELGAGAITLLERGIIAEQAVRGPDALDELEIQSVLASGFEAEGWGVQREVPYPTPPSRRAHRTLRDRCDLVLLEDPGSRLADAVERARDEDERGATLFAELAPQVPLAQVTDPRDAAWLEVKTLGQFTCRDGVPGPNRSYATELVRGPCADAKKLGSDPLIERGWIVIVLFAVDESVAQHDLGIAAHRMLDLGAPIGSPACASALIADRIGNGVCVVAAFGVRRADA
jgi:hypothetical protein